MPNNSFDHLYRQSPRNSYRIGKLPVSQSWKCQSSSTQAQRRPIDSSEENVQISEQWCAMHVHMHVLSKGPTRDLTLLCGIAFLFSTSQPKTLQPTFLQFPSCLLSILTYTSSHRSSVCNWPLIYPWHPPLNRHHHSPQRLRTSRWTMPPFTVLYLRISLPKSHFLTLPSQHRYYRDPMSYSSFPPPLPGEHGNPPAAGLDLTLRCP